MFPQEILALQALLGTANEDLLRARRVLEAAAVAGAEAEEALRVTEPLLLRHRLLVCRKGLGRNGFRKSERTYH